MTLLSLAALTIALLAGIAALEIFRQFREAQAVRLELNASYSARLDTTIALTFLLDAETGQRGYVVTGDEQFLDPYNQGLTKIAPIFGRLKDLLSDSQIQQTRLDELERLSDAKLAELARIIALRRAGDNAGALASIRSGEGKRIMDRIRELIDDITGLEDEEVAELQVAQAQRAPIIRMIMFGLLIGIVVVAIGGAAILARHLRRRWRLEQALRAEEHRVETMRRIADASSTSSNFLEALIRTSEVLAESTRALESTAAVIERKGDAHTSRPVRRAAGKVVPVQEATAVGTDNDLAFTVEALEADKAPDASAFRVVVPVRVVGELAAVLRLTIPDYEPGAEVLRSLAAYGAAQLAHAGERQKAQDDLANALLRQRAIFEGALDGFLIVNESGSIESLNPAAERIFGISAQDAMRRHVGHFVMPVEVGRAPALSGLRMLLAGKGSINEVTARRANWDLFPADLALSEIVINGRRLYVAAVRDISERKRIERLKSEFVSTVSHELRTPLTSIAGSLGLLVGTETSSLPPKAARLIDIAKRNSERLVRLVNDILDIEKIESGKMAFHIKPLSLMAAAGSAVEMNRAYAQQYGVQVTLDSRTGEPMVDADADRLAQVITNLLSNAIKFSPRGGTVRLVVEAGQGKARLSVSDTGPGIPDEFRERIFSKFAQADSSDSRQKGGTGLGLNIVKEIMQRMNGSVGFESRPGEGTTFTIELPVSSALDERVTQAEQARVLLCSRDEVLRQQVASELSGAKIGCDVAADQEAAAAYLAKSPYRAILVDARLPDGEGIAVARGLRRTANDPPIILVQAGARNGSPGAAAGILPVLDWQDVPIDPARLLEALRHNPLVAGTKRLRVLHVDDDPDMLQLVRDALQRVAEVDSTATLAEARGRLAAGEPDLVILDLALTEESGLMLLPELRRRNGRSIPVIVFSAQDADSDLQSRVQAVLTKSHTSLSELADMVATLAPSIGPALQEGRA